MLRIVESTIAQQAYLDILSTDIPFEGVGRLKPNYRRAGSLARQLATERLPLLITKPSSPKDRGRNKTTQASERSSLRVGAKAVACLLSVRDDSQRAMCVVFGNALRDPLR